MTFTRVPHKTLLRFAFRWGSILLHAAMAVLQTINLMLALET